MAEAVGIGLGVVSLVFATAESYRSAASFFDALKNCPKQLKEAMVTLRLQETCFRKAIEVLLGYIVDNYDARQMMQNFDHPAWRSEEVTSEYLDLLGGDHDTFASAVNLICERLEAVRAEFKRLNIQPMTSYISTKQQLRFALRQSKVKEILQDLMQKTQSFVALSHLIRPRTQVNQTSPGKITSTLLRKEMRRFSTVKETAKDLYHALSTACRQHDDHQALLSLSPVFSDTNDVQFTLNFGQIGCRPAHYAEQGRTLWLTVHSSLAARYEPSETHDNTLSELATNLKRTASLVDERTIGRVPSQLPAEVRFNKQGYDNEIQSFWGDAPTTNPNDSIVNLCSQGEICHRLTQFMGDPVSANDAIGLLQLSSRLKHLIYLEARFRRIPGNPRGLNLVSLEDFLCKSTGTEAIEYATIDKITGLVKQLARAVLHFHTTSWLHDDWDSQGILVGRRASPETDCTLIETPEAYTFARVRRSDPTSNPPSVAAPNQLVVRNRLLFNFGIVLLVLAYRQPLAALTTNQDRVGTAPQDVAYRTADRLSKLVSSKFGPNYAEIVRKCIHCDFGQGFDLQQPRLQEAFYRTVVCELDRLSDRINMTG